MAAIHNEEASRLILDRLEEIKGRLKPIYAQLKKGFPEMSFVLGSHYAPDNGHSGEFRATVHAHSSNYEDNSNNYAIKTRPLLVQEVAAKIRANQKDCIE